MSDEPAPLSPRERQMATMLALGFRDKRIAILAGISVNTVRVYIYTGMRKCGASTREEMIALLVAAGVISLAILPAAEPIKAANLCDVER